MKLLNCVRTKDYAVELLEQKNDLLGIIRVI